jgi:hypothetical protein
MTIRFTSAALDELGFLLPASGAERLRISLTAG